MTFKAINIEEKLSKISDLWHPRIVAQMNDYHFKLVKFKGDFIWHKHQDSDETFLVIEGEVNVEFRDGSTTLKKGEMLVIPRGVDHKPYAEDECHMMVIEPAGILNTGDAESDLTVTELKWI